MQLYHLSFVEPLNTNILTPRIPHNIINGYEDDITKRICFSTSIDGALSALQGDKGIYYVYIPKNIELLDIHYPTEEEVFDAKVNDEIWVLDPTEVIYIGCIENRGVTKMTKYTIDREPYNFHYRECDWIWLERVKSM